MILGHPALAAPSPSLLYILLTYFENDPLNWPSRIISKQSFVKPSDTPKQGFISRLHTSIELTLFLDTKPLHSFMNVCMYYTNMQLLLGTKFCTRTGDTKICMSQPLLKECFA
jgi:hypothetical protein